MKVRFAPSPTGALHIGGARTALYNWLLARGPAYGDGEMLLRIEDTDRERSTPENVEQIFDALRWLELDWDGDPIFQSQRADRHREALEQLLASGHAYHSNATADDVRAFKERHGDDRGFRGEAEDSGAVRLRVGEGEPLRVDDLIRGETTFAREHMDDPVIARADGSVLYNFAVAVDDLDAGITHVVRGEDHLSNTPKQLVVLEALGAQPPAYAHLPLLHGPDGKKLSKRHGAASVQELRDAGYLPEAVRNYLALLGWGHEDDTKLSTEELLRLFRIEDVSRNPARFDETKLRWLNGLYLRELPLDELTARLEAFTGREGLREAAAITQEKIQTLADFWPLAGFLFDGPADDPAAWERVMGRNGAKETLAQAREALAARRAVRRGDRGGRAPRPRRASRREAQGRLPARARGHRRHAPFRRGSSRAWPCSGRDEALRRIDAALAR